MYGTGSLGRDRTHHFTNADGVRTNSGITQNALVTQQGTNNMILQRTNVDIDTRSVDESTKLNQLELTIGGVADEFNGYDGRFDIGTGKHDK